MKKVFLALIVFVGLYSCKKEPVEVKIPYSTLDSVKYVDPKIPLVDTATLPPVNCPVCK